MEIAITIHSCSKGIRYFFGVHYFTVFATKDSKWLNWIIWILIHDRCPFWNPTANILHEWTQQHNSLECKNKEQHRLGRLSKRQEKLESAMEFWCAIICHFPPKTSCSTCVVCFITSVKGKVQGLLYFLLEVYNVYLGPQRFPKHARRLRRSRTWNLGVWILPGV